MLNIFTRIGLFFGRQRETQAPQQQTQTANPQPPPSQVNNFLGLPTDVWQDVKWSILFNLMRDVVWGYFSSANLGFNWEETDDEKQQMYTQWVYASTAMITLCILKYLVTQQRKKYATDSIAVTSASASIITWSLAQSLAMDYFEDRGYSESTAGYLSFWAPGLAEGSTSWSLTTFLQHCVNTIPKIYQYVLHLIKGEPTDGFGAALGYQSKRDVLNSMQKLLGGATLAVTVGAVAGSVWQIVFTRTQQLNYNPLLSGILIGSAVAPCNLMGNFTNQHYLQALLKYQEKGARRRALHANGSVRESSVVIPSFDENRTNIAITHPAFETLVPAGHTTTQTFGTPAFPQCVFFGPREPAGIRTHRPFDPPRPAAIVRPPFLLPPIDPPPLITTHMPEPVFRSAMQGGRIFTGSYHNQLIGPNSI